MRQIALASLAYEIADDIGDTGTAFQTQIKRYLNKRYSDALYRSGATMWTGASLADLADGGIPVLGLGEVIEEGAMADGLTKKRQYTKAAKFEQKYEFKLANYIIGGDSNRFLGSVGRYTYHA